MKKYKPAILLAAAALAVLPLFESCAGNGSDPSQPPLASNSVIVADDTIPEGISPNITGVVTGISQVREGITILVEIPDTKKKYSDSRYYVTVTEKTIIENADRKRCEDFSEIRPGDAVSVWFTGTPSDTDPEYSMAQGIRLTSRADDVSLTVSHGKNSVMASPTAGEVTAADVKPLLYGSYLITDGNGSLTLEFAKQPIGIVAAAVSSESGETVSLSGESEINELELPGTLKKEDYTVTVKVDYEDSADYFVFTLSVR